MAHVINLAARTFTRGLVSPQFERRGQRRKIFWLCFSSCPLAESKWVQAHCLTRGASRSCGCLQRELTSKRFKKAVRNEDHDLYNIWQAMRKRCSYQKDVNYKYYGAKRIKVCKRWKIFWNFVQDVGPRPSSRHQLHRKDSKGDYELNNCEWKHGSDHSKHHNPGHLVTVDGVTDSVKATAHRLCINNAVLQTWVNRGYSAQEVADQYRNRPDGLHTRSLFPVLVIHRDWSDECVRRKLKALLDGL
jgi:hypothetical protein